MYNTIVVGVDDSPTALQAFARAVEFATMSGGTLHIVPAYKPKPKPKPTSGADVPDEFRYAMASTCAAVVLLRRLAQQDVAAGVTAEMHAATTDPAEAFISVADREGADLIVVGNREMKGARGVLGSVSNSVAHRAHCSVLILPTT
jgi:nucleotide-binding universal stress UspA family protein